MYRIIIADHFDAAHRLPGVEVCQYLHGHTWKVVVVVESDKLNDKGMVVDFREIKKAWKEFDHNDLNKFFEMPTAENIAEYIYDDLQARAILVVSVTVWESPNSCVEYFE